MLYSFQTEKDYSELQSSMVNKAYSTLLKPLSRGLYMLELHGYSLEEDEIQMDPEFLMQIMEVNEELVDAESMEQIREIGQNNTTVLNALIFETSEAFKKIDIPKAKELLTKIKYYANIDEKVKEYEMENAGRT